MTAPARFARRAGLLALLAAPGVARAGGSFASIRARGRLRLGLHIEDTPMCFANAAGRLDGLAVAVGEALAAGFGVQPEVFPTFHPDQVSDLHGGRFDLLLTAPAMTLGAARVMMFSSPYAGLPWHVLAPEALRLDGPQDLAGRRVAQLAGWNGLFSNGLIGEVPRQPLSFADWRGIAAALAAGAAEAAIVPATMALRITETLPGTAHKLTLGQARMGIAVSFGQHDLLEAINAQLLLLRHRGVLAILHRHFLGTSLPRFAVEP